MLQHVWRFVCLQRALEREKARHAEIINALRSEASKGIQQAVQVSSPAGKGKNSDLCHLVFAVNS